MKIILDLDDFCEENSRLDDLKCLHARLPGFKVTLFMIPGRCSLPWLQRMLDIPWMNLVPHGWRHDTSRECERWDTRTIYQYLGAIAPLGLATGFKAPGWQISDAVYDALLNEGYWIADHLSNAHRRPKDLPLYALEDRFSGVVKIHGHIGHMGGHNANELDTFIDKLYSRTGGAQFAFARDYVTLNGRTSGGDCPLAPGSQSVGNGESILA
jgi:hypothetical protein